MEISKSIWLSPDKDKLFCYEFKTIWDDSYKDYSYDIIKCIVDWIEEMYEEICVDKDSKEFPIWVTETNPRGNKIINSNWTLYKVKVKWNPEFTVSNYTDKEKSEIETIRECEC